MDTSYLLKTLNSIYILSPALQTRISELVVEEKLPRKTLLLKEGMVAYRIYFIKKGFVRAFYHKGSNQFSSWFMGEGEIIISVFSFFSQKPSYENIELLDDCVLQSISWNSYRNYTEPFLNLILPAV